MTIWKITLIAALWLLCSAQVPYIINPVVKFPPEPSYVPRPLTPYYVEYLRSKNILPPPEYDREFKGELTIKRGTQNDLRAACPNSFRPGNHAIGCAKRLLDGQICIIYMLNDVGLQMIGWDYQIVLRHELGHCAGWSHPQ
jgi:hypothetical protein